MSEPLYQASPTFFRASPGFFLLSVLLIPLVIGIFMLLYRYLACKTTKLTLMEGEVLFEEGIFNKSETELRLDSIRTVKLHKTLGERIFGVGTLEIYSAGDRPEITIHGIPDPDAAQDLIREHSDA